MKRVTVLLEGMSRCETDTRKSTGSCGWLLQHWIRPWVSVGMTCSIRYFLTGTDWATNSFSSYSLTLSNFVIWCGHEQKKSWLRKNIKYQTTNIKKSFVILGKATLTSGIGKSTIYTACVWINGLWPRKHLEVQDEEEETSAERDSSKGLQTGSCSVPFYLKQHLRLVAQSVGDWPEKWRVLDSTRQNMGGVLVVGASVRAPPSYPWARKRTNKFDTGPRVLG